MKALKNYEKTIAGVKHRLFTVIKNQNKSYFYYYLNGAFTQKAGDVMIYRSQSKSKLLNKYTLSFLGVIYSLLKYLVFLPGIFILYPVINYINGCKNFLKNRANITDVRFFNWVNILAMLALLGFVIF